ncbi:hypothetical protein ACQJBY_044295 [Aegilops geniculata]
MAGSKHVSSCTCILIMLVVSSHLASCPCEARRLMAASAKINGDEACMSAGCRAVQGTVGGTAAAATWKMATTDSRGTAPGHSPGIGNKLHVAGTIAVKRN